MPVKGKKIIKKVNTSIVIPVDDDALYLEDLERDVDIPAYRHLTPEKLGDAMAKQSRQTTRWNILYAEATEIADIKRAELKVWKAQGFEKYRTSFTNSGVKPTEKMIDSAVLADPKYFELEKELAEANKNVAVLKAAAEGFRDMGRNAGIISSLLKSEMNNLNSNASPSNI